MEIATVSCSGFRGFQHWGLWLLDVCGWLVARGIVVDTDCAGGEVWHAPRWRWAQRGGEILNRGKILSWNTDYPSDNDPRSITALANISAEHATEIYLISNRGSITTPECVHVWAGPDFSTAGAGPFACVTTFPIEEARVIAVTGKARDLVWVAKFVVRPPSWNGKPLRIAMVDLPSNPTLSRTRVAQELLVAINRGDLGEVDIVAGDFNALPGSTIISSVFPTFRDSWAQAGTGLRGSWPRQFPLWSIDHVLLSPNMRAVSSVTVNPGVSKHRMNIVSLRPR